MTHSNTPATGGPTCQTCGGSREHPTDRFRGCPDCGPEATAAAWEREATADIPEPLEAELRRNLVSEYKALAAQFETSSGPSQAWQISRRMWLIRRCHAAERRVAELESEVKRLSDLRTAFLSEQENVALKRERDTLRSRLAECERREEKYREALQPFADRAEALRQQQSDIEGLARVSPVQPVDVEDLIRAAALLTPEPPPMPTPSDADREAAMAATPGPYHVKLDADLSRRVIYSGPSITRGELIAAFVPPAIAAYIALANPDTLLRLLDEREAMAADRDRLLAACREMIEMLPACDTDNPRVKIWCCNHQQKRCDGDEVIARARDALAGR